MGINEEASSYNTIDQQKWFNNLNEKESANMFKLDIDCFHEVFDYLPLNDLISMGKTCKRLQRIAGDYFQWNYGAKCARGENDGIYISSIQSNIFSHYIQKLSISGDRLGAYRFIGLNCSSIKHFRVYGSLPDGCFEYIKDILKEVEVLEMNECFIKGDFHDDYLKYCSRVKTLSLSRSGYIQDKSIMIGSTNDWLLRRYPTLENLELADSFAAKPNELEIFFQQNPNIRTFSTDARTLWENRDAILNSHAKLDVFAVNVCQSKIFDSQNQAISIKDSIYNLLMALDARGFYKRLHLYLFFVDQLNLNKMISLDRLEMLNGDIHRIDNPLPTVKKLSVCYADEIANINTVPANLPNIERIYFSNLTSTRLFPFVRYSPRLRSMKIKRLLDGAYLRNCILDVAALNEERKKLDGTRKVTIYVIEDIYLRTKWSTNSINLDLVEIRRFESVDWDDLNARSRYFKSF